MLKNNKGITLIALVITIIVLLILAGVSIAMLTGQNGILTQAKNADNETSLADVEEKVQLAVSAAYAAKLEANPTDTSNLTTHEVFTQYNSDNDPDATAETGTGFTVGDYTVKLKQSGKVFTVEVTE